MDVGYFIKLALETTVDFNQLADRKKMKDSSTADLLK